MKRRSRKILEIEALITDDERRTNGDHDLRMPSADRMRKDKEAARLLELLDDIFGKVGER